MLTGGNTELWFNHTNKKRWDSWRVGQLQRLKPRIVVGLDFWPHFVDSPETHFKQLIDSLLSLEPPPERILIFGDNPYSGLGPLKSEPINTFLNRKYHEHNKSWQFVTQLRADGLDQQVALEERIAKFISKSYDSQRVSYYPHMVQFLQDSETGYIQLVGSEVDGKLLFKNNNHLTVYGSRRYRAYF